MLTQQIAEQMRQASSPELLDAVYYPNKALIDSVDDLKNLHFRRSIEVRPAKCRVPSNSEGEEGGTIHRFPHYEGGAI